MSNRAAEAVSGGEAGKAQEAVERAIDPFRRALEEVAKVVIGQEHAVRLLLTALVCGGHVLLEGAPGVGKTLLVRTVGEVCGLTFSRIQFTPDLMPADITGTHVLVPDEKGNPHFQFQKGPVFAQLILADEINRTTPKTQAALLEAMQERSVTVAGETHPLPEPFFVLATQNPIEMEGTYPLPEAQVDRFFFKVVVPYPSEEALDRIIQETTGERKPVVARILGSEEIRRIHGLVRTVPLSGRVRQAVTRLALATQPESPHAPAEVREFVRYGVSPRGVQALVLAAKANALWSGRFHVSPQDLKEMVVPALSHRVHLNLHALTRRISAESLVQSVAEKVIGAAAQ